MFIILAVWCLCSFITEIDIALLHLLKILSVHTISLVPEELILLIDMAVRQRYFKHPETLIQETLFSKVSQVFHQSYLFYESHKRISM